MPDSNKKFHEFALQSILFKGRHDWYYCYLKSEKIAQVLGFLAESVVSERQGELIEASRRTAILPGEIAHLAAGEVDAEVVLADVFSILSTLRLLVVRQTLSEANGLVLVRELESLAERLVRGSHPSPFISSEHFSIAPLPEHVMQLPQPVSDQGVNPSVKDNRSKGQDKGQSERMSLILDLVRKKKSLSIKEIASVIKGCSEKTIQRELAVLIDRGLVRKVGERRWSLYLPS